MRFAITLGLCAATIGLSQPSRTIVMGGNYIGVGMQEIDSNRAKALKLPDTAGIEITWVEQDGPAEKAGLKAGDVVLRYNGQKVEGNEQFARLVHETPAGREVKLDIMRNGAAQTVAVKVAQRKMQRLELGEGMPMDHFQVHMPDMPRTFLAMQSGVLGVEAEAIDGQLAQYFGVKEGVLVRSVAKGSAAEKAGMRAGDVILRIEDTRVASPADISGKLRTLYGKSVPVTLMRDHKELTVQVSIGEDQPGIQVTPFAVHPHQP